MIYNLKDNQKDFYTLLKDNCLNNEEQECFIFYHYEGERKQIIKLTRKELLDKSLAVGKALKEGEAKKEDKVIIFSTQTYDNVVAALGSMLAGTIFTIIPPPVDGSKMMRFKSVMESCKPKFILCGNALEEKTKAVLKSLKDDINEKDLIKDMKIINVEKCNDNFEFIPAKMNFDDVVYIQYSSGSTSAPKGVIVNYGSLVSAVNSSPKVMEIKRIFGWVPFIHNLGLLYLIFIPVFIKDVSVGIMSQMDFLQKPARWFEGLSEFKAEGTLAPNSVYELCPKIAPAEKLGNIDLSNLRFILNGSEIVKESTMVNFAKEYAKFGVKLEHFAIGYGLSETTCGTTAILSYSRKDNLIVDFNEYKNGKMVLANKETKNKIKFVSNGKTFGDADVRIVNPKTLKECKADEFGEVWIKASYVAAGYYENEEATKEAFNWELAGYPGKYLRTGDMGILHNDELYITGRIKELIIINGNNILPNDIVSKVREEVPELRHEDIVPFSIMKDNKEKLVVVAGLSECAIKRVSAETIDEINSCIIKYFEISPYDIKFVRKYEMPHTDTGKLSIKAVSRAYEEKKLNYINIAFEEVAASKTSINYETKTENILGEIINEDFKYTADRKTNLLNLGMDSLQVVELTTNIENTFNVSIPVGFIFDNPYIEKIGEYIDRTLAGEDLSLLERDKSFLKDEVKLDNEIQFKAYEEDRPPMKKVFITGTTGFLGAYLLTNLLKTTNAELYCHVRAKSKEEGLRRIIDNMKFYKLWQDGYEKRIRPILGSLDKPMLGIDKEEYNYLAENIDTIYHNGAILNFIYPYARLKTTNVLGTVKTIKLAAEGRAKYYNYISSYSVFDNPSHFHKTAYEDDPLESCMGYYLSYSESKWVAENIIHLARERGLRAAIYRPGEITGATDTAIWKLSDSVSRTIKAIMETGEYPDMDMYIHMTQIDYIAEAIIHISQDGNNYGKAFNLLNSKHISVKELGAMINKAGYEAKLVDFDIWKANLYKAGKEHPLKLLESLFKISKNNKEENIGYRYGEVSPNYDTSNSDKALKGTGIVCEPMNYEIVKKYIDNFADKK